MANRAYSINRTLQAVQKCVWMASRPFFLRKKYVQLKRYRRSSKKERERRGEKRGNGEEIMLDVSNQVSEIFSIVSDSILLPPLFTFLTKRSYWVQSPPRTLSLHGRVVLLFFPIIRLLSPHPHRTRAYSEKAANFYSQIENQNWRKMMKKFAIKFMNLNESRCWEIFSSWIFALLLMLQNTF